MYENIGFKSQKTEVIINNAYEVELEKVIKKNRDLNNWRKLENQYIEDNREHEFYKNIDSLENEINDSFSHRIKLLKEKKVKNIDDIISKKGSITSEEFYDLAIDCAKTLGYDVEYKKEISNWLIIKKKKIELSLKYYESSKLNIVGSGRISFLGATQKYNSNNGSEDICLYDNGWIKACEDVELQQSIDMIFATLN